MEARLVSLAELERLAIHLNTLAHRNTLGRLTAEQSGWLDRLLRMFGLAQDSFSDARHAATWLRRPSAALDGEAPPNSLDTDGGYRMVENLHGRIAHGIVA